MVHPLGLIAGRFLGLSATVAPKASASTVGHADLDGGGGYTYIETAKDMSFDGPRVHL
jgi:hypothetical protein